MSGQELSMALEGLQSIKIKKSKTLNGTSSHVPNMREGLEHSNKNHSFASNLGFSILDELGITPISAKEQHYEAPPVDENVRVNEVAPDDSSSIRKYVFICIA
jgi:hypothetical protein